MFLFIETLKQNKIIHFRVAVCHYGLKTSLRETNEMKKINICMKMQNSILFTLLCTKHLFHNEANSILGNSADICCRRGVELAYPSTFCVCKIYFTRDSLRIFNCIEYFEIVTIRSRFFCFNKNTFLFLESC